MTLKEMRSNIRTQLMRAKRDTDQLGPTSEWTNAEINAKINEAYRMFLFATEMLRETSTVTFTAGKGAAPSGLISIKRLEIDSKPAGTLSQNVYTEDLPV